MEYDKSKQIYLDTVAEQIRCRRARGFVTEELKNHLEDQETAYLSDGYQKEEALKKAIQEMGDPIETGNELNRIHKPKINWIILAGVFILSVLGIVIQYFLVTQTGTDRSYLTKQILFTLAGYLVMLIVYFLDYTVIGRTSLRLWLFLIISAIGIIIFFPNYIGGRLTNLYPFLLLFVPVYGGIIYRYRNDRYAGLLKCGILYCIPAFLALQSSYMSCFLEITVSCYAMLLFAVWKKWFGVSRKKGFLFLGLPVVAGIAAAAAVTIMDSSSIYSYRVMRIKALFHPELYQDTYNYLRNQILQILEERKIFGTADRVADIFENQLPGSVQSDYILLFAFLSIGIVLTAVLLLAIFSFLGGLFRMSVRQKNRLGSLIGFGCTTLLCFQTVNYILSNLGAGIIAQTQMPFLSYGGRNTIFQFIILGLMLSIYRNTEITKPELDMKFPKINIKLSITKT